MDYNRNPVPLVGLAGAPVLAQDRMPNHDNSCVVVDFSLISIAGFLGNSHASFGFR